MHPVGAGDNVKPLPLSGPSVSVASIALSAQRERVPSIREDREILPQRKKPEAMPPMKRAEMAGKMPNRRFLTAGVSPV